ncbi:MAG: hypothetical protein IPJ69_01125 [Deltaproteobacteria bacterium]|nr:MAG: hypothetical protein IPJ69_01125 [Deltaproteobacteria bacterium]
MKKIILFLFVSSSIFTASCRFEKRGAELKSMIPPPETELHLPEPPPTPAALEPSITPPTGNTGSVQPKTLPQIPADLPSLSQPQLVVPQPESKPENAPEVKPENKSDSKPSLELNGSVPKNSEVGAPAGSQNSESLHEPSGY